MWTPKGLRRALMLLAACCALSLLRLSIDTSAPPPPPPPPTVAARPSDTGAAVVRVEAGRRTAEPEPANPVESREATTPPPEAAKDGGAGPGADAVDIPPALRQEYDRTRSYNLSRMAELMASQLEPLLTEPPFRGRLPGRLFRGVWTGSQTSWNWGISDLPAGSVASVPKVTVDEAKRHLDGRWLHIQGDSTSRQLFNSLVNWLAPDANYRAVRKNDVCYVEFNKRRAQLQRSPTPDQGAMEENHLAMCRCRKNLLFWDTNRDNYFTRERDGFKFRITYSYKELMYDDTDEGLLNGGWPEIIRGKPTGRNLYEPFEHGLPDMWLANSGGHSFHLRVGLPLSAPDDESIADYVRNISRFATMVQTRYMTRKPTGCMLWRTSNVPPTESCPPQHMLHANRVTAPALQRAGFSIVDVEDLSRYNRQRPVSCNIHAAPQKEIAQLTASALVHGCTFRSTALKKHRDRPKQASAFVEDAPEGSDEEEI